MKDLKYCNTCRGAFDSVRRRPDFPSYGLLHVDKCQYCKEDEKMAEERKKAKEVHGFKIESGIKLPQAQRVGKHIDLYNAIEVDESFLCKDLKEANNTISAFRSRSKQKKDNRVFKSRKVEGGRRIWRTK